METQKQLGLIGVKGQILISSLCSGPHTHQNAYACVINLLPDK